MFTEQFFDLLLNLNEDWKVSNVKADYKSEELTIQIDFIAKKANCPKTNELCS